MTGRVHVCVCVVSIAAGAGDYCQWERFTAACDSAADDEVIVVETARYGRMRLGRCIKYDLGFIGCSADVLRLADAACSGRRRCEIALPNEQFDRVNPCLSELKSYLTASYRCLKGSPQLETDVASFP